VARTQRRRRVDCRLKCEILISTRRRVRGRVVSLSEGGLAVVADVGLEQGDPIRIVIDSTGGLPAVRVSAIVWNDLSASPSGRSSRIRKLGCVVSQPSRSYLTLLQSLVPEQEPRAVPVPLARPLAVDPEHVEPDLPRSRELQPPPKQEPEESLPYFRVRMKQIGGPRTRVLTLRARSATQAERLAFDELDQICSDSECWAVLHIARMV
jgi:PilZ domain